LWCAGHTNATTTGFAVVDGDGDDGDGEEQEGEEEEDSDDNDDADVARLSSNDT